MGPAPLSIRASAVVLAAASSVSCMLDFDQYATPANPTTATSSTGASSTTAPVGGSGVISASTSGSGSSTSAGAGGAMGTGGNAAATAGTSGGAGGAAGDADGGTAAGGSGGSGTGGAGGTGADGGPGGAGGSGIADASGDRPQDGAMDISPPRDVVTDPLDGGFNCASVQGLTYQGHCYFPSLGPYTWTLASMSCPFGAHLVTITSAGEQAIAAQILPTRDRWIGLHKDMNTPDVIASYFWVTQESTAYSNWDQREGGTTVEPNFSGDCVRIQFNSFWADDVCTSAYPALCERE